jgi:hypothetical protein
MDNKKRALIVTVVTLVGLTGAYLIYQYFATKAAANEGVKQPNPTPVTPPITDSGKTIPTPSVDNNFPLKKGSKNDYVKQLQLYLGVTVDGIFGSKTEAALIAATGSNQVASFADLQKFFAAQDQLSASATDAASLSVQSNNLLSYYDTVQDVSKINVVNDTVWRQVAQSADGSSYTDAGYYLNWLAGKTLDINSYQPDTVDSDGYLILYCPSGDNAGYWKANPNDINIS